MALVRTQRKKLKLEAFARAMGCERVARVRLVSRGEPATSRHAFSPGPPVAARGDPVTSRHAFPEAPRSPATYRRRNSRGGGGITGHGEPLAEDRDRVRAGWLRQQHAAAAAS